MTILREFDEKHPKQVSAYGAPTQPIVPHAGTSYRVSAWQTLTSSFLNKKNDHRLVRAV